RKNSAASIGIMSARQSDAEANERPNAGDHPTTNRDHLQRTSGTLREGDHAESGFKRLVRATYDHQTEMKNRTKDEQSNYDEQRHQNDKRSRAAHPGHRSERVVTVGEEPGGLQPQREQQRDNASETSTDERVNERLT